LEGFQPSFQPRPSHPVRMVRSVKGSIRFKDGALATPGLRRHHAAGGRRFASATVRPPTPAPAAGSRRTRSPGLPSTSTPTAPSPARGHHRRRAPRPLDRPPRSRLVTEDVEGEPGCRPAPHHTDDRRPPNSTGHRKPTSTSSTPTSATTPAPAPHAVSTSSSTPPTPRRAAGSSPPSTRPTAPPRPDRQDRRSSRRRPTL